MSLLCVGCILLVRGHLSLLNVCSLSEDFVFSVINLWDSTYKLVNLFLIYFELESQLPKSDIIFNIKARVLSNLQII